MIKRLFDLPWGVVLIQCADRPDERAAAYRLVAMISE